MYRTEVKAYYDYTLAFYRLFWHGETRAVHYGIWDHSTKKLKDALLKTNEFLAEKSKILPGERVLDAGCGVGGSTLWLVENKQAKVTGITVSPKQKKKAEELANRRGLEKQATFLLEDFTKTSFWSESFDVIWAIESVCYAEDKKDFLKEAFRLLKPGGRLIVADGFLEKENLKSEEKKLIRSFLDGFVLDNLARPKEFEKGMEECGFEKIEMWDVTQAILPTARAMYQMSRWSWPLSVVTTWLHLTPKLLALNNRAGIDQYVLFKERILTYKVFKAEKR